MLATIILLFWLVCGAFMAIIGVAICAASSQSACDNSDIPLARKYDFRTQICAAAGLALGMGTGWALRAVFE